MEQAAKEYGGVEEVVGVQEEVYSELGKTPAHYIVKLNTPYGWFVYQVDAYTGRILSGEANLPQTGGQTASAPSAGTDIGSEQAKTAALRRAGVQESAVTELKVERDVHNSAVEYEVEFTVGGVEYEYTVGGGGSILEAKADQDEDREKNKEKDHDDDDDHEDHDDHDDDDDD